tara:strand:+ start:14991 stop:15584 length:594 start_codon:yes stop_codon:yes gene_type:complete
MTSLVRQLPNLLTLFRLIAGPAGAACLWISAGAGSEAEAVRWWGYALALFLTGAITDGLDGWLARRFKAVSNFGALIDPIADKVFVGAFLIVFAFLASGWIMIAAPVAAIIARDALMTGLRLSQLGRTANPVPVSFSAKLKTVVEMAAIGWFFLLRFLTGDGGTWSYEAWIVLLWLSAALSLYTAIAYLLPHRAKTG